MSKGGQVEVLNSIEWHKLERQSKSVIHITIWALLRHTGCRSQEARLLTVENVYADPSRRLVRDEIFFPKSIRKGKKKSLSVPVNDKLRAYLERYQPPESGYLFPSPRNSQKPISYEAVYKYMKDCVAKAGYGHRKIATHSGRRSLITTMDEMGISAETIRGITGHVSLANLQVYIDTTKKRRIQALNAINL